LTGLSGSKTILTSKFIDEDCQDCQDCQDAKSYAYSLLKKKDKKKRFSKNLDNPDNF
jgi:hypothetical protein